MNNDAIARTIPQKSAELSLCAAIKRQARLNISCRNTFLRQLSYFPHKGRNVARVKRNSQPLSQALSLQPPSIAAHSCHIAPGFTVLRLNNSRTRVIVSTVRITIAISRPFFPPRCPLCSGQKKNKRKENRKQKKKNPNRAWQTCVCIAVEQLHDDTPSTEYASPRFTHWRETANLNRGFYLRLGFNPRARSLVHFHAATLLRKSSINRRASATIDIRVRIA